MTPAYLDALLSFFHSLPEDLFLPGDPSASGNHFLPGNPFARKNHPKAPEKSVYECAAQGFLVLKDHHPVPVPEEAYASCVRLFGRKTREFNQTFHKSFSTVYNMTEEEYYTHQILHYFTTYGAELLGIDIPTYLPSEVLQLPEESPIPEKLTLVRTASGKEIEEAVNRYAKNAVSPGKNELARFRPLLPLITIPTEEIRSFELRIRKYELDGTVPEDPVSFLRFLVYVTTGETLLIKNDDLLQKIILSGFEHGCGTGSPLMRPKKAADTPLQTQRFLHALQMAEKKAAQGGSEPFTPVRHYFEKADLASLASVFYRYKPIFLAFRRHEGCAPYVNRIRRLAEKYHKPLTEKRLANAVRLSLSGDNDFWRKTLSAASARDLVKLYGAVCLRLYPAGDTPGVYRIRNGKLFVKDDALPAARTLPEDLRMTLTAMREDILETLSKHLVHLQGKVFYIPPYISYAVPQSERQFVGNYPYGTMISTPVETAFTAGIHWVNQQGLRIDLDLHLSAADAHFGWNGSNKDGEEILYTGDMTDAPEPYGAAEAFYFRPDGRTFTLSINKYSGPDSIDFTFFVTKDLPKTTMRNHYTFDPGKTAFPMIPLTIKDIWDMNLGVFMDGSFFIYGGSLGEGRIPTANYRSFIEGIEHVIRCRMDLTDLLQLAGASVIHALPGQTGNPVSDTLPGQMGTSVTSGTYENDKKIPEEIIDLSPEALTPRTLLDLLGE